LAETIDDTKTFTISLTPPPDPCAGVTCPNKCDGYNLYSQKCVNGVCVNDTLIEGNSPTCGYVPPPAKGGVYQLDYPASAKNGEVVTVKAKVVNTGGTGAYFSLRLLMDGSTVTTRYVGAVGAYKFGVEESLSVTMPSSGASANLSMQCLRVPMQ
jgi:hypothetical protein